MNINKYISRINYKGILSPELNVLKELQKNHLLNVPFENLDIHYNRPIELDIIQFYRKIVIEKRGGFCYELNGLFQYLLDKLGFNTKRISARVYDGKKEAFGSEYDHMAILVELNQLDYLVDVGFGEFAFNPLKIESIKIQKDPRGDFVIERKDGGYMVSKIKNDVKNFKYRFTTKDRPLSEFQGMCAYHQTNPKSHFTHKKLISIPTENGRTTITGNALKITENDSVQKNIEFPMEMYEEKLYEFFKIDESKIKANR